jgi:hypothetical protein
MRSHRCHTPHLGVALLCICQRILHEMPAELLYTENHFRFTSSTHAIASFDSPSPNKAAFVHSIELHLFCERHVTTVYREWTRYLVWAPVSGIWARKVGSLCIDAPRLRTLRWEIDKDVLWTFFERLFIGSEGLDRIAVTGDRMSSTMAARELSREATWSFSCRQHHSAMC